MAVRDEFWGVIINPRAGKKRFKQDKDIIDVFAEQEKIMIEAHCTQYAGHATKMATEYVNKGITHLLVLGGDGTLNEVVNGIYKSDVEDKSRISISVIPYGTGNDWARYWGLLKKDKMKISKQLLDRKRHIVDIGLIRYISGGEECTHYFLNGTGYGFDGQVVKMTNALKKVFGGSAWTYKLSVLAAVFTYKPTVMHLKSEDKAYDGKVFTIAVGNGCYTGGGLKQTPKAVPTDGLFHITAVGSPTFKEILSSLKCLFEDRFDESACAHNFVSKEFTIELEKELYFETDGVLLQPTKKINIQVVPSGLGMYV